MKLYLISDNKSLDCSVCKIIYVTPLNIGDNNDIITNKVIHFIITNSLKYEIQKTSDSFYNLLPNISLKGGV